MCVELYNSDAGDGDDVERGVMSVNEGEERGLRVQELQVYLDLNVDRNLGLYYLFPSCLPLRPSPTLDTNRISLGLCFVLIPPLT